MKCEHCSAEWTVRNSQSKMTKCPFCGAELVQVTEVRTEEVTMASVLTEIIARFGEETVTDKRRCISLFQDLAPDLEYEQRLLRMALQTFDIGAYFVSCAESDREKNVRKAIRGMEGMLAEDAQKTIITSFVAAFGWDKALLTDFYGEELKGGKEEKPIIKEESEQPEKPVEVEITDADTLYHEGEKFYNAKNYKKSVEYYRKAAEKGHATAQNDLGFMYQNGFGVPANDIEAVLWYRKAAEQELPLSQNNLGWMFENGRGVAQDYEEAIKWYTKAAEQNFAGSQYNLGRMYENGMGVNEDISAAKYYYTKAAENGSTIAKNRLDEIINEEKIVVAEDQFQEGWKYDNAKEYSKAIKWYKKAARQGHKFAQYNLGVCYANSRGVTEDCGVAAVWYSKAAEQGHAGARNNLGLLYLEGKGVDKNYATALDLFQKADAQGNMYSDWNLGRMYENGWGVTQDIYLAKRYYLKAAELGHTGAQKKLEEICNTTDINLRSMRDRIKDVRESFNEDFWQNHKGDIGVMELVSLKKARNVVESYAKGTAIKIADIKILFDPTFWGGGKDGLVLTEQYIIGSQGKELVPLENISYLKTEIPNSGTYGDAITVFAVERNKTAHQLADLHRSEKHTVDVLKRINLFIFNKYICETPENTNKTKLNSNILDRIIELRYAFNGDFWNNHKDDVAVLDLIPPQKAKKAVSSYAKETGINMSDIKVLLYNSGEGLFFTDRYLIGSEGKERLSISDISHLKVKTPEGIPNPEKYRLIVSAIDANSGKAHLLAAIKNESYNVDMLKRINELIFGWN